MREEADETSTSWKIGRALYLTFWLTAAVFMGLATLEFGTAVDGIGYGHLHEPTYVTALLIHAIGAVIVILAYQAYRGRIPYAAGFLMGPVFWVATGFFGGLSLELHYGRICDTAEAPAACYAAVWRYESSCLPQVDDTCFERLERSCRFGKLRGCDKLVANDSWSEAQVCEALSDTCDETIQCGSRDFPKHCNEGSVASFEAFTVANVCEAHQRRCGAEMK